MDDGDSLVTYSADYWNSEVTAARERSFGSTLARLAEAVLYAKIPVKNIVDIGTGPGYFLDAVSLLLPENARNFHGIEKYPPPPQFQSKHPNYFVGDADDFPFCIDLGLCIEVIEHLTPRMLTGLLKSLASRSTTGALYIFNTGLAPFVNTNRSYLDPTVRGHIVSYSIDAVKIIAEPLGFCVRPLRGRHWAFVLEYSKEHRDPEDLLNRIWTAPKENVRLLESRSMGSALKILGYETARAYHYGATLQ